MLGNKIYAKPYLNNNDDILRMCNLQIAISPPPECQHFDPPTTTTVYLWWCSNLWHTTAHLAWGWLIAIYMQLTCLMRCVLVSEVLVISGSRATKHGRKLNQSHFPSISEWLTAGQRWLADLLATNDFTRINGSPIARHINNRAVRVRPCRSRGLLNPPLTNHFSLMLCRWPVGSILLCGSKHFLHTQHVRNLIFVYCEMFLTFSQN